MTDNMRGILALLASSTAFVFNDAVVKLVTTELPTSEIIVVRGIMATIILAAATTIGGAWRPPQVLLAPAMATRLITSVFSTIFIVAALAYLPLPTTAAILQMTPLVVTAGAALLLGAHVGWRRWSASLAGFLGVLLIVKPGTDGFVTEAWIAMCALLFTATRDLTTRFIDPSVPSLFVAVASSFVVTIGGLMLMPIEAWIFRSAGLSAWVWPSTWSLGLLAFCAGSLYFAYYFGIVAMRIGEIPVVAPFRYTTIVLSLLLGWLLWSHVPDRWSMLGITVITAAGLYLLHREQVAARAASAAAAAAVPPAPVRGRSA